MNKPPTFSTAQNNSNFRSLSRTLATVSALGICVGLTAPACIASRYTGGANQDGATNADAGGIDAARFDAAGLDAAGADAAVADLAADLSRSDSGSGAMDAGPDLSVTTPDLSVTAPDLSVATPDLSGPTDDAFDPASCGGPAVSSAQALAMLGTAPRVKLADATLYYRNRSCTTTTPPTCGAWSTPIVHKQDLLTYSGGSTTAWKSFTFPTHLFVFAQSGQAKFVIRHESDVRKYPMNDMRGVGFSIGVDPMENTYPVIYVWDFAPAPSRYEDLQGRLLNKGQLHVAEHCARVVFSTGMTEEIAALYKF